MDLFRRLLLATWQWAVFQALREDAQRRDTQMRRENAESDRLAPFYRFGFEVDDQLSEQWQDLKRSGRSPEEAQPGLRDVMQDDWSRDAFEAWCDGHGTVDDASNEGDDDAD